ncbi:MAG: histidinol-phosphate aminotransferase family protein [Dehalococcoidia bacterium]|nr:histidinol-phosphate aminotransferase family protein [Dehalococcoidia bacterium]
MPPSARPHLTHIKPAFHGGAGFTIPCFNDAGQKQIMDFSTCCNPYGPPKAVRTALRKMNAEHYPDPDCSQLIMVLSRDLGLHTNNLIIGSGSTELIRLTVNAYAGPGDTIVIPCPTYSEYELAAAIADTHVIKYIVSEKDGFKLDCKEFILFAGQHHPAIIFLCNPNNPTGQYLSQEEVANILEAFPETLVVLDEAYIAFTDSAWQSSKLLLKDNLFIMRSMTKEYAIAGLRLGYGMASKAIITNLKKVRPPWNVNTAAQEAGLALLSCQDQPTQNVLKIKKLKKYLVDELTGMGFHCVPTNTNFFMFKTGNSRLFHKQMLGKGILVRDCTSFGLPEYVRIAPLGGTQCRKFIHAVREIQAVKP